MSAASTALQWPRFVHLDPIESPTGISDIMPPAHLRDERLAAHLKTEFHAMATDFEKLMLQVRKSLVVARPLSQDTLDSAFRNYAEGKTAIERSIPILNVFTTFLPDDPSFEDVVQSEEWKKAMEIANRANSIADSLSSSEQVSDLRKTYEVEGQAIAEYTGRFCKVMTMWNRKLLVFVPWFKGPENLTERKDTTFRMVYAWDKEMGHLQDARQRLQQELETLPLADIHLAELETMSSQLVQASYLGRYVDNYLGHMVDIVDAYIRRMTPKVNVWSRERLVTLKSVMPAPLPVDVAFTEHESLDTTLTQRQLKDNHCGICLEHYTGATSTKCEHIFCFECIVPYIRQYRKCPMCRQTTNLCDTFEVTRMNEHQQPAAKHPSMMRRWSF